MRMMYLVLVLTEFILLLCLTTQTPASLAEPLRINYAKHGIGLKR